MNKTDSKLNKRMNTRTITSSKPMEQVLTGYHFKKGN